MQLSLLIINIIAWHKFTIDYKGKETQNGERERERERERDPFKNVFTEKYFDKKYYLTIKKKSL